MAFLASRLLTEVEGASVDAKRWLAPPFTALVFLVYPFVSLVRPVWQLRDPGIGWHLATGRQILATGEIPRHDIFSFTAAGHPWINYYWLFDTAGALLERIGGLPLYATACMLLYAAVPVLLYRRMLRMGASILVALALTLLAQIVFMSHAHARPHVVTYLLFAFFLGRLDDVHAGRRPPASLWVLPPLATLWCNLHGGFLAGIALTGIFTVVTGAQAVWTREASARRAATAYAAALAGLVVASAVNPYGFALHLDALHHLGMKATGYFNEFRSPDFRAASRPVLAFEVLVLATLAVGLRARRRLAALEIALLAFFLHQALHAVRHINLFAIVAAPIVARELSVEVAAHFPAFAARWRAIAAEQGALHSPRLYFTAIVGTFLALALTGSSPYPDTLDDLQLSRGASAFIASHTERFARPFNTDNVGGALIHRFWPDVRVFFDDRLFLYGDRFAIDDYMPVHTARPEWREVLDRHGIQAAVVSTATAAATVFRTAPDWRVAFEDDKTVIFFRQ